MHITQENPSESILYRVWKEKKFDKDLQTCEGIDVTVLDPGEENIDLAGPDFKNARVRIGNIIYVGDIEIDNEISFWKRHGHNIDKHYSKVILHIALKNPHNTPFVFNREGRKIPTVNLSHFINKIALQEFTNQEKHKDESSLNQIKCHKKNNAISFRDKLNFINSLGIERFKKKSEKMLSRLKELTFLKVLHIKEPVIKYELTEEFYKREFSFHDFHSKDLWMQLFYEYLFEALGYSKNKDCMMKLAKLADIKLLKSVTNELNPKIIESALLNISGILPNHENLKEIESQNYAEEIKEIWQNHFSFYDGEKIEETSWHFFKLRPQNFPTIRIAGGAILIHKILNENLIAELIKTFEDNKDFDAIINKLRSIFIIHAEGFWKDHYVFDKKANNDLNYFIGVSRADEIIVNVVLPFITLYSDVFNQKNTSYRAVKIYSYFKQKSDNTIVRSIAEAFDLNSAIKKSITSQGMIELFRSFCSKGKCLECEIGKNIFN